MEIKIGSRWVDKSGIGGRVTVLAVVKASDGTEHITYEYDEVRLDSEVLVSAREAGNFIATMSPAPATHRQWVVLYRNGLVGGPHLTREAAADSALTDLPHEIREITWEGE